MMISTIFRNGIIALLFVFLAFVDLPAYKTLEVKDVAILLSAKIDNGNIVLNWKGNTSAYGYKVNKKKVTASNWDLGTVNLDSGVTTYTDTKVQPGVAYEYQVMSTSRAICNDNSLGKDSIKLTEFIASGYICAGIDIEPEGFKGKVLLLIEEILGSTLGSEIARLSDDLRNEGWVPIIRYVPRTDSFSTQAVKNVKAVISQEYNSDKANLKSVFILGRVAVSYSGRMNPDGHPDHVGAWPSDVYYGSMAENEWTDNQINDKSASRNENKNIPGDGKFDQSSISSDAVLSVGRVDFSRLTKTYTTINETELLRKYLDKDHNYRVGITNPVTRGFIYNGFGTYTLELFASSGWRNFASLCGPDSIREGNWFNELGTNTYLWAYGCGGGTYTSASGVGNSADFATKPVNAVFTMLFGSYFGDWDASEAFMRSALASSPSILTCAWAARPHWYFHHMGIGYPIGYSTLVSQNNVQRYIPNSFYLLGYPNGVIYAVGMKGVHVGLMGDPTLIQNISGLTVPKILNLSLTQSKLDYVAAQWEAPDKSYQYVYNIYRSMGKDSSWTKLNSAPLVETTFRDTTVFSIPGIKDPKAYYYVRSMKKTTNNSGSVYVYSNTVSNNLTVVSVDDNTVGKFEMTAYPNPAETSSKISINLPAESSVNISIMDVQGNLVYSFGNLTGLRGEQSFVWSLTDMHGNRVPQGVYLIKVVSGSDVAISKVVVLP